MDEHSNEAIGRHSKPWTSKFFIVLLVFTLAVGTATGGFAGGAAVRYWLDTQPQIVRAASTVATSTANSVNAVDANRAPAPRPGTAAAVYAAVAPAVVTVTVNTPSRRAPLSEPNQGEGSGFIVDDQGRILTNNHVVQGAQSVAVTLADGTRLNASVVGSDPASDLAVLKADIPASKRAIAPLGDSDQLVVGDPVLAIGSPFGLEQTMTAGIVSALKRTFGDAGGRPMRGLIQTDAPINPGNSGGPLLNLQGEVVGITTAIESPVRASVGLGFAIPSNAARQLLPQLSQGTNIEHPYMGISGQALTPALASQYKLTVDKGVLVMDTPSDGPAARAGIRGSQLSADRATAGLGDIIVAVDGKEVRSVDDIANHLDTKRVGDTVTIDVIRDGQALKVEVKLAAWPQSRRG